jgi:hypothetical protein
VTVDVRVPHALHRALVDDANGDQLDAALAGAGGLRLAKARGMLTSADCRPQ